MKDVKDTKIKVRVRYGNMRHYEYLTMNSEMDARTAVSEIKSLRPDAEIQIITPS